MIFERGDRVFAVDDVLYDDVDEGDYGGVVVFDFFEFYFFVFRVYVYWVEWEGFVYIV